jgi:hypothetical protein
MRFALIDEFKRSIPTSHHVQSHASFLKAGISKHNMPVAPNILNRDFTHSSPNKAWAGDII